MIMELKESKNPLLVRVREKIPEVMADSKDVGLELAYYSLCILHWNDESPAKGVFKLYDDDSFSYIYGGINYYVNSDATEICVSIADVSKIIAVINIPRKKKKNYILSKEDEEIMLEKVKNYKCDTYVRLHAFKGDDYRDATKSERLAGDLLYYIQTWLEIALESKMKMELQMNFLVKGELGALEQLTAKLEEAYTMLESITTDSTYLEVLQGNILKIQQEVLELQKKVIAKQQEVLKSQGMV